MLNLAKNFQYLLLFSGSLIVTACEKTPEKNISTQTANVNTELNNKIATLENTNPKTGEPLEQVGVPAHIFEYQKSMDTMHQQMMVVNKIINPDIAFATGMIAHHQGAINMAKIQLKYGNDTQMLNLAKTIIKAQQTEIEQMQAWLINHKDDNDLKTNSNKVPDMDMEKHHAMLQGITDSNSDIAFAKGMIPHHQMAIQMADFELKNGKDPQMLKLAKQIKSAQDPEIKQMQAWLKSKGQ